MKQTANDSFVLLGANFDKDYEETKEWKSESDIAWRSFISIDPDGWYLPRDPYSYVIDADGTIRFHGTVEKAAKVVEKLMAEAGQQIEITL